MTVCCPGGPRSLRVRVRCREHSNRQPSWRGGGALRRTVRQPEVGVRCGEQSHSIQDRQPILLAEGVCTACRDGLTCCACEQVGSGAVEGNAIDLYECDGCTSCGWLLTPHSPTVTQISYASDASYCITRSSGVLQLQPCNNAAYSDQQWYVSSAVSTRQVLELHDGAGRDVVCVTVLCGIVGQGDREHARPRTDLGSEQTRSSSRSARRHSRWR